MRAGAIGLLALLILPLFPAPAAAADPGGIVWEYRVTVPADGSGTLHVEVTLLGAKGRVAKLTFHPGDAPYPVHRFGGPRIAEGEGGPTLTVTSDVETWSYDVYVNKAAPTAGEFLSYLGREWGLVRAEALSVPFNFTFPAGSRPTWDARLTFATPTGWTTSAAWSRDGAPGAQRYRLPAGEALPTGFLYLGAVAESRHAAGGREIRLVEIDGPLPYRERLLPYLHASAPYFRSVYGDTPGGAILVVAAPDPMFRGGLAAPGGFYVHATSDLRTAAHEHAHVWQTFSGRETAGDASTWLPEGAAELHGTLSLVASGDWTLAEANRFFRDIDANRTKAPFSTTPLAQATYGAAERVAYGKGALALASLDQSLVLSTKGRHGLADVFAALNRQAASGRDADVKVSNADLKRAVASATGLDVTRFLTDYVYGTAWPGWIDLRAEAHLVVVNVTTTPAIPLAGRDLVVRATLDNRGYAAGAGNFTLLLDGQAIAARRVEAPMGGRATAEYTVTAPREGLREARIGAFSTSIRVASPARLQPVAIETLPAPPAASSAADVLVRVRNDGDFPAPATLVLLVDNVAVGERSVTVGANSTTIVGFSHSFTDEGSRRVTARLYSEGRFASLNATLAVGPADRDRDGVPDAVDAFPDNPTLSEAGVLNTVRNLVPGPAALAALAAFALVALAARRR